MENSKYTALSSKTKPNKNLVNFITSKTNKKNTKILDWGSGKGRHTKFLRDIGYEVWSYDPYNGEDTLDGYNNISKHLPDFCKFDIVFSAYVLNVVPKKDLSNEIRKIESYSKKDGIIIHKVREDFDLIKKAAMSKDCTVEGKKGSIQRIVSSQELVGYKRNKKSKLYFKRKGE